jgi:hypothetical protein
MNYGIFAGLKKINVKTFHATFLMQILKEECNEEN